MDGEAGWWTTSGNIGLPPLARAMGVGRQHNTFTTEQVIRGISNCSNSNFGPDKLSFFHQKNLWPKAIEYLTALFNDSVTSCRIPAIWKSSIVIPIPKPGKDSSLGTSYRPISLLCPAASYGGSHAYHYQHTPAPRLWPTRIPTWTINHFCSTTTDEWCRDRLQSKETATSIDMCRCWPNGGIWYSQP